VAAVWAQPNTWDKRPATAGPRRARQDSNLDHTAIREPAIRVSSGFVQRPVCSIAKEPRHWQDFFVSDHPAMWPRCHPGSLCCQTPTQICDPRHADLVNAQPCAIDYQAPHDANGRLLVRKRETPLSSKTLSAIVKRPVIAGSGTQKLGAKSSQPEACEITVLAIR
jgi:hypothetical protein